MYVRRSSFLEGKKSISPFQEKPSLVLSGVPHGSPVSDKVLQGARTAVLSTVRPLKDL